MLGLVKSGQTLNPCSKSIKSVLGCGHEHNTIYTGIEVWVTSRKDVKSLESAHKDMARVIPDLPWAVEHVGVLIPLGWSSGEVTEWEKDTICWYNSV